VTNELHEILQRFNALPDDAILPSRVTGIILGVSERTIRYHPNLPRVQISRGRYGQLKTHTFCGSLIAPPSGFDASLSDVRFWG
jgi:hypothetical protein